MASESKALYTTKPDFISMLKSINEKVNGSDAVEAKASLFGNVALHQDHQFVTMRSKIYKESKEEVFSQGVARYQIYIDHIDDDGAIHFNVYFCSPLSIDHDTKSIGTSDTSTYYFEKPTLEIETREYHDQLAKESGWTHSTEYVPKTVAFDEPQRYVTEPDLRMMLNAINNKSLPDTGDYKTLHIAEDSKYLVGHASLDYNNDYGLTNSKYVALMHHEIAIKEISDDGIIILDFKPMSEDHPYLGSTGFGTYGEDGRMKVVHYTKYLNHKVIHMYIETPEEHQGYIDKVKK